MGCFMIAKGKVTPWGGRSLAMAGVKICVPSCIVSICQKFSLYHTHLMFPERRRTVQNNSLLRSII
jgi:hypothetical protein